MIFTIVTYNLDLRTQIDDPDAVISWEISLSSEVFFIILNIFILSTVVHACRQSGKVLWVSHASYNTQSLLYLPIQVFAILIGPYLLKVENYPADFVCV